MNKPIRRLFIVTVLMFASLAGMLGYHQVVQAQRLAENPYNTRKVFAQMRIERGLILMRDKSELSANRLEDDLYYRTYPGGDLAPHVTGYSDVTYGQTGLERSRNDYLTGTADEVELFTILDTILGREKRGADLRLTLVPEVQREALDQLRSIGKNGAVVVLEVKTGAVVAMVSSPSYDPNLLEANWEQLNADPVAAPLFNRATQEIATPGSSFKLITTAAALETGAFKPDSKFDDTKGSIDIYGNTINNYRTLPFGKHDLADAFAQSINTTYAQVGDELGQETLFEYMKRFGLYERPPLELPEDEVAVSGRYEAGKLAGPEKQLDPVQVAWMAIGQENLQVTPLQMAMIAQAIGNGGEMMAPYLIDTISDYHGTIIRQADPKVWKTPIDSSTAAELTEMMIMTVEEGTGSKAQTSKTQIAAKTGTAEVEGRGPNAWFVGFAPAEDPKYAIAVLVEDAPDESGAIAVPLARDVLLAALGL
ncbi:MAG: penicillin-binding protein 2 [Gaiellales bacterium]|nr:MAG: penicillin-binding protein 2 [Gaiellales bacterium]